MTAEMLFEKNREQLRRKEEQCSQEMELKQQLEFTLRTLDLELRTVRNHLKQVEEEKNDTQRLLSQEQNVTALQARILNNPLWKQKVPEASTSKMTQTSEDPDSNEKEKYLLHKNQTLQDEVVKLKLELDTVKTKDQEKENQYAEENEVLKEKNIDLQKELKLNEEALTKTISQYNGQVNVMMTEKAMLVSKLENEKGSRERLETEIESYRSRLTSAIRDHECSQTSKLDIEHKFQRERDEWLCLQDKLNHDLSTLGEDNGVLSQELSKAESKANSLQNELYHVSDSLREKTLILESTERELNQAQHKAKELEHRNQMEKEKLNKYIVKLESLQERLAQIQSENMLLRQQVKDTQDKSIIKEEVSSEIQIQFIDLINKLRADTEKQVLMVEERNKELISECNHLREQRSKYENEKAETELHTERETLKKLMELNQFLENRLEQEIKRNGELEKDLSGFKKLLKTTKKKLKEHEKGNVYKGEVKQTDPEITREINRLKNKIEDLIEQLETVSTKWKQSESINRSLQEELLSAKILQKKYDKMQENERQLKEEVVNLRHHLEITKTQAAAQGELEQLRENNSASMRNLMEQKIRYLESKMKNSRGEAWKTELEGYRQLLSEELKARKSLSNRLDRTTERLNDLSCQLLKEQQKKKILIASCATSPAQEPSYIGNVNTSMFLSRNLFPRGDLEYSPGDPVSSESTVEAYFSKMQQELEESITRELNEVTDKIESRP